MGTEQFLSLVDYLAYKAKCTYVSDLHDLDNTRKSKIAHELGKLDPEVCADLSMRKHKPALGRSVTR